MLVAEQQLFVRSSEGSSAALRRTGSWPCALHPSAAHGALLAASVLLPERSASGLPDLKARILAARGVAETPLAELSKELAQRAVFTLISKRNNVSIQVRERRGASCGCRLQAVRTEGSLPEQKPLV